MSCILQNVQRDSGKTAYLTHPVTLPLSQPSGIQSITSAVYATVWSKDHLLARIQAFTPTHWRTVLIVGLVHAST